MKRIDWEFVGVLTTPAAVVLSGAIWGLDTAAMVAGSIVMVAALSLLVLIAIVQLWRVSAALCFEQQAARTLKRTARWVAEDLSFTATPAFKYRGETYRVVRISGRDDD